MSRRQRQGGFTIIELLVVITIAALAVGGVALSLGATAQVKLRSSCWTLVSAVRYAYSHAVTRGMTTRIVIDFEARSFHIEETKGRVVLSRDGETEDGLTGGSEQGGGAADGGVGASSAADMGAMQDRPSGGDMALGVAAGFGGGAGGSTAENFMSGFAPDSLTDPFLLSMSQGQSVGSVGYKRPPFKRLEGRGGQDRELEGKAVFSKAFTPHEPKARTEGRAYVYFFPGGLTEHSIVQISDGDDRVYSVEVHPLTGRAVIHTTAIEPEEDLDSLQEAEE